MQVHRFSGTHRQVGRAHGEELREGVRVSVEQRLARCLDISRRAGTNLDAAGVRGLARACLRHVGKFSPGQLEELRGIAEGAGALPEDVLIASGYTDFKDVVARGGAAEACECTALWAGPGAAADGSTWVAQTWDMFAEAEAGVVWMRLAVEGEPEVFVLAYAGCVGMTGLNDRGVALAVNNLTPTDARPGVPWTFLNRAILAADDAEGAWAAMRRARLCSGHNFVIGDASGAGFSVETTGTRLARLEPEGGTLAHSNHYLAPELKALEKPPEPGGTSPQRLARMREILAAGAGQIDRPFLETALRDHQGGQQAICVHDRPTASGGLVRSCAAMILNATRREAAYITGNPCKGEFATLAL